VDQATKLGDGIPVMRFLVTVDLEAEPALEALSAVGADGLQPHGRHAAAAAQAAQHMGYLVLRPVPVGEELDAGQIEAIPDRQIPLLDTADEIQHGGTGRSFHWAAAGQLERRFVLAGGLGPDNVKAAIAAARPWGVDASSRLEVEPGIKDHGKVAAFIEEARGV
jgi:phosphoribosylanthranilate isomerase